MSNVLEEVGKSVPENVYFEFDTLGILPEVPNAVERPKFHFSAVRVDSVRKSYFLIFPCPQNFDRLEVMCTSPAMTRVYHEQFYDYGPNEVALYIHNAISLGFESVLQPDVLSKVDPSTFWSFVHHIDTVMRNLPNQILATWNDLIKGAVQSRRTYNMIPNGEELIPRNGRWPIRSESRHLNIAHRSAHAAFIICYISASVETGGYLEARLPAYYKGTVVETAYRMNFLGGVSHEEHRFQWNKIMKPWRESEACLNCGREDNLKYCKCKTVAFCSKRCQRAMYKDHSKRCKKAGEKYERVRKARKACSTTDAEYYSTLSEEEKLQDIKERAEYAKKQLDPDSIQERIEKGREWRKRQDENKIDPNDAVTKSIRDYLMKNFAGIGMSTHRDM